jgi:hypothetical protein
MFWILPLLRSETIEPISEADHQETEHAGSSGNDSYLASEGGRFEFLPEHQLL